MLEGHLGPLSGRYSGEATLTFWGTGKSLSRIANLIRNQVPRSTHPLSRHAWTSSLAFGTEVFDAFLSLTLAANNGASEAFLPPIIHGQERGGHVGNCRNGNPTSSCKLVMMLEVGNKNVGHNGENELIMAQGRLLKVNI